MPTVLKDDVSPRSRRGVFTYIRQFANPATTSEDALQGVSRSAGSYHRSGWRYSLVLAVSMVALAVSLLDFALIVGAVAVPIPGLRTQAANMSADTATYGFELGTDSWVTRGMAANAISSDTQAFAGHRSLEFQVTNVSDTQKAFVYCALPANTKPATFVLAHVYVPAGAPPLLAAVYVLDNSWTWQNGPFPTLAGGQWTAVTFQIPQSAHTPIRELGLIIVDTKGFPPYTGPLFVDSIDIHNR